MNCIRGTSSSRSTSDHRTHYKVTRTFTDADGKTRTETVEMTDDDNGNDNAIKLMRDLRLGPNEKVSTNTKQSMVVQDSKDFTREALQIHNDLRRKHGVEPLKLNNDLSKLAQQWANHLASTGSLVHSKTKYQNFHVGENLRSQSWPITGKEMTESWYKEHQKYDFHNRKTYQSGTGHFTQIVWKNTQEVGFARAQNGSSYYAVAMYYPAGNFLGEFDKNVLPSH